MTSLLYLALTLKNNWIQCLLKQKIIYNKLYQTQIVKIISLQCFNTVGTVLLYCAVGQPTGRASIPKKRLVVGGDILTGALHVLLAPVITSTTTTTKNGDIMVPANPGPPGKWLLNGSLNHSLICFLFPTVANAVLIVLNLPTDIFCYSLAGRPFHNIHPL